MKVYVLWHRPDEHEWTLWEVFATERLATDAKRKMEAVDPPRPGQRIRRWEIDAWNVTEEAAPPPEEVKK